MNSENNPYANYTWVWTYDRAGNIPENKEYALTAAGSPPKNPLKERDCRCNDSQWGDLLTNYRGQALTYHINRKYTLMRKLFIRDYRGYSERNIPVF